MAKISFWEIFNTSPDGSLEPKKRIQIGGVQLGPGIRFSKGIAFGGIDFTLYVGRDLEIDQKGEVYVITGIY